MLCCEVRHELLKEGLVPSQYQGSPTSFIPNVHEFSVWTVPGAHLQSSCLYPPPLAQLFLCHKMPLAKASKMLEAQMTHRMVRHMTQLSVHSPNPPLPSEGRGGLEAST